MTAPQRVLLKDQLFNPDRIARLAAELQTAHPALDVPAFVAETTARFPELELKQRISWITDCLERHLPDDFRAAVGLLLDALPAPCDPSLTDGDFGDFIYAPYAEYVARHGCTPDRLGFSLAALREITTRFSAEFAIRPFIDAFPDHALRTLLDWAGDEHYHVRRLCSEGTRPRLPWAGRLSTPVDYAVPLLDRLHADPTRFVTRSVANHVNDIAKVDAALAVGLLERWQSAGRQDASEMAYVVRHATRSLVKRGDPGAMRLLGIPTGPTVEVSDVAVPDQVELGSALEFSFTVTALEATEVIADYVIHYPGHGERRTGRRVYKIRRLSLEAGQQVTLTKAHRLPVAMTTRQVRPGRHELEIQVNGRPHGRRGFHVTG